MILRILSFFILILPVLVRAEFGLSTNLNAENRQNVLKVLGLGTSSKNISIPKGLSSDGTESGRNGLEVSIANEFINTEKIAQFLTDQKSQNTLYYPKISIGKGIYERTDIFIHFIPYTATLGLSEFGGTLRFFFFKDNRSPLTVSTVWSINSTNFNNQLTSKGMNADISFGMNWDFISVFSSVGVVKSKGTFVGGSEGTTDTLQDEIESVSNIHYSVGALARYDIFFVAAALDYYAEAVYTLKCGFYF